MTKKSDLGFCCCCFNFLNHWQHTARNTSRVCRKTHLFNSFYILVKANKLDYILKGLLNIVHSRGAPCFYRWSVQWFRTSSGFKLTTVFKKLLHTSNSVCRSEGLNSTCPPNEDELDKENSIITQTLLRKIVLMQNKIQHSVYKYDKQVFIGTESGFTLYGTFLQPHL